jgi:outer membrane protein assembly factor BamD
MWKKSGIFIVLSLIMALSACKSSFDTLLTSTDNEEKLRSAYNYFDQGEFYKAQLLFEQVMPFYRGTPPIDTIYFKYANTHYNLNNYILASYYFKNYTTTFANGVFSEEALYMTAFSNYKMSPSYKLDQTYTQKAIDGFQLFANRYPTSGKVPTCNALIDELRIKLEEKAVAGADLYFKLGNYQSADHAYRNLLKEYPDSKDAEKIRHRIVLASYKLAENTIEIKQAERYVAVLKNCADFTKRYTDSEYSQEVNDILKASKNKLLKLAQ